jgi:hypothetical protein
VSLTLRPLTLKQANDLVAQWHRHHKPCVGHRFSLGAYVGDEPVGAAIVGRPVSRMTSAYDVAEVTRLVTNGYQNACSFLYGACARVAKEMGFRKIQTFILASEPGTSLRAVGWEIERRSEGGDWNTPARGGRRTDQPMEPKVRYGRTF